MAALSVIAYSLGATSREQLGHVPKILIQSVHTYGPSSYENNLNICMTGFENGQGQGFALQLNTKHTLHAPYVSHVFFDQH